MYTKNDIGMVDKVLMREDRKKNDKIKNLNLRNLIGLQVAYLALKILLIIASIFINPNSKFGINDFNIEW